MVKTALLSLLAAVVIAADWIRLERPPHAEGRLALLVVIAVLPALAHRRWLRLPALAAAAFVGLAVAFSLSPRGLWPDGVGFFGTFARRFGSGFVDFYQYHLPIVPAYHARMHMLLLAAIFGFTLLTSLAIASRRAVPAVMCFLIAAGWPATLLAGGHTLLRGAIILAAALVLLAGLTERTAALAVPAVAVVVVCALALSSSPAVAKDGLLDWQHWNPYVRQPKAVSVSYVWNSSYAGIHFPARPTTVLTITAPSQIGTYWRATVLDRFVHDRWVEHLWRESRAQSRVLSPVAARKQSPTLAQQVVVGALRDRHLVGASMPVGYEVNTSASYLGQGVALTAGNLQRGQRYLVWSVAPQPTVAALVHSPPSYPAALTRSGRELELAPGVNAPVFGTPGRDTALAKRLVGPLQPYRQLLALAERVAGATRSPYAAVIALERWLRTTGGFAYSEQPPQLPGVPPLVGFALDTRSGYCQHFAGAMALMVRLLGIPARVAAGFVNGRYSDGRWTITDRDAHTWVEVWFRGYGWLPFDPTPGRGQLAGSYSDASPRFDAAATAKLLAGVVRGGEVFNAPAGGGGPEARLPAQRPATAGLGPLTASETSPRHHSLLRLVAFLAFAVVAAIATTKFVRRRSRYLTRDPRRLAAACARELGDFLADQRVGFAQTSTIRELGGELAERFAVDAVPFAQAVEAARFGRPAGAGAAAAAARNELGRVKRQLRRRLSVFERVRGSLSLRSLGFS
jgi:transglutaminase superfamily protein/transglutaminase TgpA-like protein